MGCGFGLTERSLGSLYETLDNLTNLSVLRLEVSSSYKIEFTQFERFIATLSKLNKLNILDLEFSGVLDFKDKCLLDSVLIPLSVLTKLSKLILCFRLCGITQKADVVLANLPEGFSGVEELKLDVSY